MRLDRLLSNQTDISRQQSQRLISRGEVMLNGQPCSDPRQAVTAFDQVSLGQRIIQASRPAYYLMLNKPAGCVSATTDPQHPTVLDWLPPALQGQLHIAGRLDFNTTGLMLLTNDGNWSKRLTLPSSQIGKTYFVTTEQPITPAMRERFAEGMYFAFEDLITQPAQLEILSTFTARLTIHEGRYHQIKRMFGHFGNKVVGLHRESIGPLHLDPTLSGGDYRPLSAAEIALF